MLDIRDIDVYYGNRKILYGISFTVNEGEFVGIIGPNGTGKTTLIKTITGVLKPRAGAIFLDGTNIERLDRKEIARIMAVVPQSTPVTPMFTVQDVVLMGRYPHLKNRFNTFESESDLKIADEIMRLTDVYNLADRSMDNLSGGERQEVIIARALAQQPKILLLDEPTSNLDIKHQIKILELVKGLTVNNEITALMAIHDLNLAARFCDRLILLHNHRIQSIGEPEIVLTKENIKEAYEVDVEVNYISLINSLHVVVLNGVKNDGID